MPNIPSLQDQNSQNGHHASEGNKSDSKTVVKQRETELPNSSKTPTNPSPNQSKPSASLRDEWSSVTQELIDTLPQVWTRGLVYLLLIFTGVLLPWAMFSKVEDTGSARGRLEPKGRTLRLDAPVAGTVAAIKVKEGETVKAGQTLLEMESELTRTELQQAQAKLEGHLNRVSQLELMQNQLEIAMRTQRLQSQAQQSAQLAQIDQTKQRLNFSKSAYGLRKDRWDMDKVEMERYTTFVEQGIIPQVKLVEKKQSLNESQRLLNQAASEIQQAQAEIKQQQSNYENVVRTGELTTLESDRKVKEIQSQIVGLNAEVAQTKKQIQSWQLQLKQRILRAPTDGIIFQLSIQNAGSVLQQGQPIAQIAPKGAPLVFRAQMPSRESGFLKVGMPVKLKFDAYPFQDYGVVQGHLSWVSPDSKIVETVQGKTESFELEIALDQTYIQNQNKPIFLTPGQTATAEVIVRQRRVIDLLIDPFRQLQKGGFNL
jgi:hemolysin D